MTEAFLWLRSHLGPLPAEARQQHTEALITQLAEWAVSTPHPSSSRTQGPPQQGDGAQGSSGNSGNSGNGGNSGSGGSISWAKQLMELPLSGGEEEVLVSWLVAQAEAGKPAGDLLPLYFLQECRVSYIQAVSSQRLNA